MFFVLQLALMKKAVSLLILLLCTIYSFTQVSIFSVNGSWKFNDSGLDLGSLWKESNYNDGTWTSGNAELGYGDGDENTVVSYGNSSSNKHITTYFRKTFYLNNPNQFQEIIGSIKRDDGAVVYVNGYEVFRTNMPNGTISFNTLASSTVAFTAEDTYHDFSFSPAVLVAGNNTIAVEIHQDAANSSDISFNMSLQGSTAIPSIQVTREPYLNVGTSTSMIVRWQTSIACDSKVMFGTSPSNLSQQEVVIPYTTEHEVKIDNLLPNTLYYYSIGTNGQVLSPASSNQYFKTSPITGAIGKYRFWAIGDAGMSDGNQRAVRDGFYLKNQNQHIDGWIMLGDNAYGSGISDGTQSCYQTALFDHMYSQVISKTVLWPALGNHDYNNHIPFSPAPAYFDIFSLPTQGEAGGLASGTEKYYSYNYGNIHFIILDSYDEDRSANGTMATWLLSDLQQCTAEWIIAYWHHPPYTKGSHDSDNPLFMDGECEDMRENILPILEQYGVDLVLNGHSHSYERSMLIDSHYGTSGTLSTSMILDAGKGGNADDCPYEKHTTYTKSHQGTVYAVVGCSGKLSSVASSWPHPVTAEADYSTLGSMIVTVEENILHAEFIRVDGTTFDHFSIVKNAGKRDTILACPNDLIQLKPSYPGKKMWLPTNEFSDSLQVLVTHNTLYFATDTNQCIVDTFVVQLLPQAQCIGLGVTEGFLVEPNANIGLWQTNEKLPIQWSGFSNSSITIEAFSIENKRVLYEEVENFSKDNLYLWDIRGLNKGLYFIRLRDNQSILTLQVIIY